MSCRLCANSNELCRSHIIPEFLYQPLYDEKHRFSIVTKGTERTRYAQLGLSEKLLCRNCEQRFGGNEKYAAGVISGKFGHRAEVCGNYMIINNIDYTRFKLFQLSILWRASVSTIEFFKLVSLGPREEKLRRMLLSDDPGDPDTFGCSVTFMHDRGEDMYDTFFNPEPMRWAGRRMHKLYFAGAAWVYHCDQRPPVPHLQKLFLQRNGRLICLFGEWTEARLLGPRAKALAKREGYA